MTENRIRQQAIIAERRAENKPCCPLGFYAVKDCTKVACECAARKVAP